MTRLAIVSVALLGFSSAACAATNSATLTTNQIKPAFEVKVHTPQESTDVYAILNQPTGMARVELVAGDALTASSAKDGQLAFSYDSTLQIYTVHLKDAADRGTMTIALARATGTPAPSSTVAVPAPLAFTEPAKGAQVPFAGGGGTLKVAWSNAVSGATVHFIAAPCGGAAISTKDISAPDTGSFTLATRDLSIGAPPAGGRCTTIQVRREVMGVVDPAFAPGSTFKASRADTIDVNLMP